MNRVAALLAVVLGCVGAVRGANKIASPNAETGETDLGLAATWGGTFPTSADNVYLYQSAASQGYQNRFYLDGSAGSETDTLASSRTYIGKNQNTGWKDLTQILTLDLLGGAVHTAAGLSIDSNNGGLSTLRVRDEGTQLTLSNDISAQTGRSKILIENGAAVSLLTMSVGSDASTAVTNEFTVDGAVLNVTGTANFGQYSGYRAGNSRKVTLGGGAEVHFNRLNLYETDMTVNDAVVTLDKTTADYASANLSICRGATVTLAGGSVTGAHWSVGASRGYIDGTQKPPLLPAKLRITGGHHYANLIHVGYSENMTGVIEVDGDDAVVEFGANFYGRLGYNAGCTGIVTVTRGTMAVLPNTSQTLRLAPGAGAYGELNVAGGLFDYGQDCESGIWMDTGGDSKINVSGGELRTVLIRMLATSPYRADLVQSGGLVNLSSYAYAQSSGNHIVLTGGEFRAPRIAAATGFTDVTFLGDGGAVVVGGTTSSAECGSKAWFENFTSVAFGAKGLSFDTAGYASRMKNAFADATGESGLFVKKGNGTLTVDGSYAVAKTRVECGTLALASASVPFATALTVVNGAAFSLVGAPTTATLSALALTNGVLKLDPTDVLTVTGPVSLSNPCVELASLPTKDTPCDLLVVTGSLDAETLNDWQHAVSKNVVSGQHVSFTSSYDGGTGKTTLTATLKDDAALTSTTTWTGSGAWGTAGNWSAGVPTLATVAQFTGSPASRTVTVGNSAVAGALSFLDGNYVLSGGKIEMDGEKGQVRIDAALGSTNVISSTIATRTQILSETAGSVTLNGPITDGGLEMAGTGHLALGAENAFAQPVVQRGGVLECTAAGALTTQQEIRHMLNAVKFSAADTVTAPYRLAPAASTDLMTVNNAADVTFTDWRAEGGRFLKRGAGTMTVRFSKYSVMPVFNTGGSAKAVQCYFPEDGSLPYYYSNKVKFYYDTLGAVNVAEGNLVWTSDTPGLAVTTTGGKIFVGFNSSDGTAEAKFTIRDIDVTFGNDPLLELGQQSYRGAFSTQPTFELINSTTVFNTICIGDWCYGMDSHPTVSLTNSWLSGGSQVKLSQANGYGNSKTETERAYVYWRAKDSKVTAGVNCSGFTWFGGLKLDFDRSTMSRKDGVCDTLTGMGQYSYGYMSFTNGSVFAIKRISALGLTHPCALRFAGSTWKLDDDFALASTNVTPAYFSVETCGDGLIADVSPGKTLTFQDVPLTGAGGLTVTGGGTVKFESGQFQLTGKIAASSGVIDLTDEGILSGVVIGSGAGTIKGGKFNNATIALDAQDGPVPNFENCTFSGKTHVSIAGTLVKADGVKIATYTGSFSDIRTFKFAKTGEFRGENFRAENGEVTVEIVGMRGLMVIIRH